LHNGRQDPAIEELYDKLQPKSVNQASYIKAIRDNTICFGVGPPGSGKTYIAAGQALEALINREVDRIILIRPAVQAEGENLGFIPGNAKAKIDVYLRPLYDILDTLIGVNVAAALIQDEIIQVAQVAYLRGRTLDNCFIIFDEAQNATKDQLKLVMNRLGENSKLVVTGDPDQIDLKEKQFSSLVVAETKLSGTPGVGYIRLEPMDQQRNAVGTEAARLLDLDDGPFEDSGRAPKLRNRRLRGKGLNNQMDLSVA